MCLQQAFHPPAACALTITGGAPRPVHRGLSSGKACMWCVYSVGGAMACKAVCILQSAQGQRGRGGRQHGLDLPGTLQAWAACTSWTAAGAAAHQTKQRTAARSSRLGPRLHQGFGVSRAVVYSRAPGLNTPQQAARPHLRISATGRRGQHSTYAVCPPPGNSV